MRETGMLRDSANDRRTACGRHHRGGRGPSLRPWLAGVLLLIASAATVGWLSMASTADAPPLRFQPRRVIPPQPAIVDAPVIPAEKVSREVTDEELVLGVVVNGEARAYPINMLTGPRREIINDTLGETPIAATW